MKRNVFDLVYFCLITMMDADKLKTLVESQFGRSSFEETSFKCCSMVASNFSGNYFDQTIFSGSNLSTAKFSGCFMFDVDLTNTTLDDTDFDKTIFCRCKLEGSTGVPKNFESAKFIETEMPTHWIKNES